MNGKLTCKMLKSVRKQIADANNIDYEPRVCHFEGNCRGTCPACEAEMRYLESQLSLRQAAGKVIKIVGLATGISAAMASCISQPSYAPANYADSSVDSAMDKKADVLVPNLDSNTVVVDTLACPKENTVSPNKQEKTQSEVIGKRVCSSVTSSKMSVINPPTVGALPSSEDSEYPSMASSKDNYPEIMGDEPVDSYHVPDSKAQYRGGNQALREFLQTNIVYPKSAIEDHMEGKVIVEFIVEIDGRLSDVHVVRSVYPPLDREAVRVVSKMPEWVPAVKNNRYVKSKYRLPVSFKLN